MVYGNEDTRSKRFFPNSDPIVKIGRNNDNQIVLEHHSFSRIHTSFNYSKDDQSWYLQDGISNKQSTNGTWYTQYFNLGYIWIGIG